MIQVTLDIPEDDDSSIVSRCMTVLARLDKSTGQFEFVAGHIENFTILLLSPHIDNNGKPGWSRQRVVFPVDEVESAVDRDAVSRWIERHYWERFKREFQRERERELEDTCHSKS